MTVHIGEPNQADYCNGKQVRTAYIHPDYNGIVKSEHDIAILELEGFFLPQSYGELYVPFFNRTFTDFDAIVAINRNESNVLLYHINTLISNYECFKYFYKNKTNDNQICITTDKFNGDCKNDIGNSLIYVDSNAIKYVIGMLIDCEPGAPALFLNVSQHACWILDVLNLKDLKSDCYFPQKEVIILTWRFKYNICLKQQEKETTTVESETCKICRTNKASLSIVFLVILIVVFVAILVVSIMKKKRETYRPVKKDVV